jgi:lysophospholipase L1-like esterase
MSKQPVHLYYLALGDSYTIGEGVPGNENFPSQVAFLLSPRLSLETRIVAKTGWTTDELVAGIKAAGETTAFREYYDFVSLLIGVNNQYRGRPANEYENEFRKLLDQAIQFSGNNPANVVVLSIPDWGVTPYAEGRDRKKIAEEIDDFNRVAKNTCLEKNIYYIDITPGTRDAARDPALLTSDGLHPSGREYKRWAKLVADYFKTRVI